MPQHGIGRPRQPLFVTAQGFQYPGGEVLGAVPSGMTERSQQPTCNKDRNFVDPKSEKPSGLPGIKSRRSDLPAQEFGLLRIHATSVTNYPTTEVFQIHKRQNDETIAAFERQRSLRARLSPLRVEMAEAPK